MTTAAPACVPLRQTRGICFQRLDVGGPVLETYAWPTHAWILDRDELHAGKYALAVVRTRTWRCLRCGEAWSVSGEPAPGHFG